MIPPKTANTIRASDRGLYSDITRKAEVYFDIGHFPFPLTVTDTPGVNDPLLIREEISRQYLKESDFFVVVSVRTSGPVAGRSESCSA